MKSSRGARSRLHRPVESAARSYGRPQKSSAASIFSSAASRDSCPKPVLGDHRCTGRRLRATAKGGSSLAARPLLPSRMGRIMIRTCWPYPWPSFAPHVRRSALSLLTKVFPRVWRRRFASAERAGPGRGPSRRATRCESLLGRSGRPGGGRSVLFSRRALVRGRRS